MQKISIMGCGWLGYPLAKSLIKDSYDVNGSTTHWTKLSKLQESGITPFRLVLTADGIYEKPFFDTDILFLNIPPGKKDDHVEVSYLAKIKSLFGYLPEDIKIVFASSTGVYPNNNGVVDETTLAAPVRASGKAILAVENILKEQFTNVCILRYGGLTGPGRKAGSFLASKKDVPNGNGFVNLVHLDDCIALTKKIISGNYWGETFNIVADEHPTRKELYTLKAREAGLEPPQFSEQNGAFKKVSNAKIKKALNYEFKHPDPMEF